MADVRRVLPRLGLQQPTPIPGALGCAEAPRGGGSALPSFAQVGCSISVPVLPPPRPRIPGCGISTAIPCRLPAAKQDQAECKGPREPRRLLLWRHRSPPSMGREVREAALGQAACGGAGRGSAAPGPPHDGPALRRDGDRPVPALRCSRASAACVCLGCWITSKAEAGRAGGRTVCSFRLAHAAASNHNASQSLAARCLNHSPLCLLAAAPCRAAMAPALTRNAPAKPLRRVLPSSAGALLAAREGTRTVGMGLCRGLCSAPQAWHHGEGLLPPPGHTPGPGHPMGRVAGLPLGYTLHPSTLQPSILHLSILHPAPAPATLLQPSPAAQGKDQGFSAAVPPAACPPPAQPLSA